MNRAASSLLLALALIAPAVAEEVIVRKAQPAAPVELRGGNLAFVLPTGSIRQSLNGAWLTRSSEQPMEFTARIPEAPLLVRHTAAVSAGEGFSMGSDGAWSRTVGLRNRSSLVLEATEKTSFEAAFETQIGLDQAMSSQSVRRAEAVLRSTDAPGLTLAVTGGRAVAIDASQAEQTQNYTTVSVEQKLPWLPVRLSVAPSLGWQEATADGDRALVGGSSSLLFDATGATTLSTSLAQYDSSSPISGLVSRFRAYSAQIEQRLTPSTAVRLRLGYEEQWSALAATTAAVFLGADSTFSLGESLTGGFQIRQRALQVLGVATGLPETILSFSLGSAF
jgi:hypothetical protein